MVHILYIFASVLWCPTCLDYASNMAGVLLEAGTAYHSRAHAVHPRVFVGSVLLIFLVSSLMFLCFVCLRPVSFVPNVLSLLSILDCSSIFSNVYL